MKQLAVIGLGRFGKRLVTELIQGGAEVLAIDSDPELVQDIASIATNAVALDATDADALRSVGLPDLDGAVVAIGENIEASILTVSSLAEMGVPLIVARAVNSAQARILAKVGANRVVFPEDDTAINVAQSLVSDYVVDYFAISSDLSVVRLQAPASFVGQTLRALALRPKYNVSVVAIDRSPAAGSGSQERQAGRLVVNMPGPDAMVEADDLLVVLGNTEALKRLRRDIG